MTLCEKISSVQKIYQQTESRIQFFKQVTGLNCVAGCGDCCNRFEPYITVLEGLVVAEYLKSSPDRYQQFISRPSYEERDSLCPFYIVGSDYHCGIYSIRPLICRMYSFCAKKNKEKIEFQACPPITEHYGKELALTDKLLELGLDLPIYLDEYNKLCQIDFMLATDFHPLERSIDIALESYSAIEDGSYYDQPTIPQNNVTPFKEFIRNHLLREGLVHVHPS